MTICSISISNSGKFFRKEWCLSSIVLITIALAVLTKIAWNNSQYRVNRAQMLRLTIFVGATIPLTLICRCFCKYCLSGNKTDLANELPSNHQTQLRESRILRDERIELEGTQLVFQKGRNMDGLLDNNLFIQEPEKVKKLYLFDCDFSNLQGKLIDIMGGADSTLQNVIITSPESFNVNFFENVPVSLEYVSFYSENNQLRDLIKNLLIDQRFTITNPTAADIRNGVSANDPHHLILIRPKEY